MVKINHLNRRLCELNGKFLQKFIFNFQFNHLEICSRQIILNFICI